MLLYMLAWLILQTLQQPGLALGVAQGALSHLYSLSQAILVTNDSGQDERPGWGQEPWDQP